MLLARRHELERDQLEALALEAGEDCGTGSVSQRTTRVALPAGNGHSLSPTRPRMTPSGLTTTEHAGREGQSHSEVEGELSGQRAQRGQGCAARARNSLM